MKANITLNTIYNEDCFDTMRKLDENSVDIVLTSPPYNTSRVRKASNKGIETHMDRYDVFNDEMTDDEYISWTKRLFNEYDKILKKDGCILYNLSYSSENTYLIWLVIAEIINNTNFTTADTIIWKKKSALPNNTSKNKLTRITEYVFVFCRKSEINTFNANKRVKSIRDSGQKYYENTYNFIEAKNNDGTCKFNKATYSSELCIKLLEIYANKDSIIYDSFMGTGTTAVACKKLGLTYIGSELSLNQCEFAEERLKQIHN